MGPDHGEPAVDRQTVYETLTSALQELRGGVHAADMARTLLRRGSGSTYLVALDGGGDRAIFYNANAHVLSTIPFDRHGLTTEERREGWTEVDDPAAWVDANADRVEWVHPRYRETVDSD